MNPKELLAAKRAELVAKLTARNDIAKQLDEMRGKETVDPEAVTGLLETKRAADVEINTLDAEVRNLELEIARDDVADDLAKRHTPTGALAPVTGEKRERVEINERRTYNKDADRKGVDFVMDVIRAQIGNDFSANERLRTHMEEEKHERERAGTLASFERAVGSSAFSGIVVPQYALDLAIGVARGGRPLADSMTHHDLPEKGMTVEISRLTTGTSADVQTAQNATLSETDADDTILSVPVRTAGGTQTVSRQAANRGTGVVDTIISDLIGAHDAALDSALINTAAVGLSAIATAIAYTDASPTAAELYPKMLGAQAAVVAAMLGLFKNDTVEVMSPARWYWLQAAMVSTWPLIGQPGIGAQQGGVNNATGYAGAVAGRLPNGSPVIMDASVPVNKGVGTNEDEIYVFPRSEAHLWEDPNAPFLIKAEQTNAKSLGIDLVLFSDFAFTFGRVPTAIQKIGGTGLVTPSF